MMVRVLQEGFYGGSRRMPGQVFNMAPSAMTKDDKGKVTMPFWVESADKPVAVARDPDDERVGTDKGSQVI